MATYALSYAGKVVAIFTPAFPDLPISEQINAGFSPVDITTLNPQPQVGWTATETNGAWTFSAPAGEA